MDMTILLSNNIGMFGLTKNSTIDVAVPVPPASCFGGLRSFLLPVNVYTIF